MHGWLKKEGVKARVKEGMGRKGGKGQRQRGREGGSREGGMEVVNEVRIGQGRTQNPCLICYRFSAVECSILKSSIDINNKMEY